MYAKGFKVAAGAVVLLLGLGLAGCGGSDGTADPSPSSSLTLGPSKSPATPSPTVPSGVPTDEPTAPTVASASLASAKQFAVYVLNLQVTSLARDDMSPLTALLAPGASCPGCKDNMKTAASLRSKGRYLVPDSAPKVKNMIVAGHVGNERAIGITYDLPPGKEIDASGKVVDTVDPSRNSYIEVGMKWNPKSHKWMLLDYAITLGKGS